MATFCQIEALGDVSRAHPSSFDHIRDNTLLKIIENARKSFEQFQKNLRRIAECIGMEINRTAVDISFSRERIQHALEVLQNPGVFSFVGRPCPFSFSLDEEANIIGDYGLTRANTNDIGTLLGLQFSDLTPEFLDFLGTLEESYKSAIDYWNLLERGRVEEDQLNNFPSFIQTLEKLKRSLHVAKKFEKPEIHIIPPYQFNEIDQIFTIVASNSNTSIPYLTPDRRWFSNLHNGIKPSRVIHGFEAYIVDVKGLTCSRDSDYESEIASYRFQDPNMPWMDEMTYIHFAAKSLFLTKYWPDDAYERTLPVLNYKNPVTETEERSTAYFTEGRTWHQPPLTLGIYPINFVRPNNFIYYPMVGGPVPLG